MAAQERIIDKDINKRIKEKTDLLQSSMDEDRQQMLVAHNRCPDCRSPLGCLR